MHNALILRPVLGANDARLTTHETCSLPSSIKDSWLEWDGARWARAPAISCTALPHTPERLPASPSPVAGRARMIDFMSEASDDKDSEA